MRDARRSPSRDVRVFGRVLSLALVLIAAGVAAFIAHVAIDVAGDYLLPRDSYDFVTHHSRAVAIAGSFVLAATVMLRVFDVALAQARGARLSLRAVLDHAISPTPWRFVALVVAATLGTLGAMDSLDTLARDGKVDDIADMLGGSIWLGLGIATPTAALIGSLVWHVVARVARSSAVLVRALGALFATARSRSNSSERPSRTSWVPTARSRGSILARREGKRAPPRPGNAALTAA